jgi:hypothetical protein
MAVSKVKSTYSLDESTVRRLADLARRWGVSKSEALRRAILAAAGQAGSGPLAALDRAQQAFRLSGADAARWAKGARAERHASSRKVERSR